MVVGTTGKFWPFKPIGINDPRFSYTKSLMLLSFRGAIIKKKIGKIP